MGVCRGCTGRAASACRPWAGAGVGVAEVGGRLVVARGTDGATGRVVSVNGIAAVMKEGRTDGRSTIRVSPMGVAAMGVGATFAWAGSAGPAVLGVGTGLAGCWRVVPALAAAGVWLAGVGMTGDDISAGHCASAGVITGEGGH